MPDDDLDFGQTIRGFAEGQKVFGRYILRKVLGRGGMGIVWLAWDEKLEEEIALKFMPEMVRLDDAGIRELKRETRKSLKLTHANIVRIRDFVEDTNSAAIAMEYVDGPTLSALRYDQPGDVFSPAQFAGYVDQLVSALTYAHGTEGVIHRDIKPANLMVNSRGQLKVADFGISGSVTDSVSRMSMRVGSSGSPPYMSPQQVMGELPQPTDDIYSVGATIYELLTGKPPFYSGNIYAQIKDKVPAPMTQRRAELGVTEGGEIPALWEEAVALCLAKDPEQRPQSARQLLDWLEGREAIPEPDVSEAIDEPGVPEVPPQNPPPEAPEVPPAGERKNPKSLRKIFGIASAIGVLLAGAAITNFLIKSPTQSPPPGAIALGVDSDETLVFLNERGEVVKKLTEIGKISYIDKFSEGTAPIRQGDEKTGKWGLIDTNGTVVIKPQFDDLVQIVGGRGTISRGEGSDRRVGFVDRSGKMVVEPVWNEAKDFHEGLAAVRQGDKETGKWGFIDIHGKVVIPPQWAKVGDFGEGLAPVQVGSAEDGEWGYIDQSDRIVIEPQWNLAYEFKEGLASVKFSSKQWGAIDRSGKVVIQPKWDSFHGFSEGLAAVGQGEILKRKDGFIDKTGRVVIEPEWDFSMPFRNGLAEVKQGKAGETKWGLIDRTGKIAVEPVWDSTHNFTDTEYILVRKKVGESDKYGLVDRQGKVVIEPVWQMVIPLPGKNLARVGQP